jgi:hypothetical protein
MKIIYCLSVEDPFEVDAFFDEDDKIITWWSCNDATWRDEYMSGLLKHCGYKTERPKGERRERLEAQLRAELQEYT